MSNVHLTNNEIAMHSMEEALELVKLLVRNGYVAAASIEEELVIVNYVWTPRYANRSDIVFQSREDFDQILDDLYDQAYEDGRDTAILELTRRKLD